MTKYGFEKIHSKFKLMQTLSPGNYESGLSWVKKNAPNGFLKAKNERDILWWVDVNFSLEVKAKLLDLDTHFKACAAEQL